MKDYSLLELALPLRDEVKIILVFLSVRWELSTSLCCLVFYYWKLSTQHRL